MGQPHYELGQVQGEDDQAIRLHVSGKISETQLDRQRKFVLEKPLLWKNAGKSCSMSSIR